MRAVQAADPTRPRLPTTHSHTASPHPEQQPLLTAIFIRDKDRLAVINGGTYRVGDHFQGGVVVRITHNSVELEGVGGKRHLTLLAKIKS